MEAAQRHSKNLEQLRQLGVRIAIDDFGTGYSSFGYLATYPVTRLKIAQELVFPVTTDSRSAAVVRAAIDLGNALGIEVIAEGVETDAHARFLATAGCDQAQGYHFSRPLNAARATEFLRSYRGVCSETGLSSSAICAAACRARFELPCRERVDRVLPGKQPALRARRLPPRASRRSDRMT